MAYDLCANLDQLLAQTGQRPWLRRFGIASVRMMLPKLIGQRMELKTHGICGERTA
jgi:hypothetical protein